MNVLIYFSRYRIGENQRIEFIGVFFQPDMNRTLRYISLIFTGQKSDCKQKNDKDILWAQHRELILPQN
jgi:hypothetical protein